jgi:hypothetical protein
MPDPSPTPLVLTLAFSPPRPRELLCTTLGGPDCGSMVEPGLEEDDPGVDIRIDGASGLATAAKKSSN